MNLISKREQWNTLRREGITTGRADDERLDGFYTTFWLTSRENVKWVCNMKNGEVTYLYVVED